MARTICLLLLTNMLTGCYYMQAAGGQLSLMSKRQNISNVLGSGTLPPAVEAQLRQVQVALDFATDDLELPDNGSYRSFVQLPDDYVVWNVFAAPALSLSPRQWCFPVVGCVAYRGYFSEARAERYAERFAKKGDDVAVRGAGAYSTLGRFKDPVLSSMLSAEPLQLIMTLFHELAHQKLYVRDDVEFNESYASAVADIGLERWVATRDESDQLAAFRERSANYRQFTALALTAREALDALYGSEAADTEKLEGKAVIFSDLAADYSALATELGLTRMPRPPASNAEMAPISTYNALIPQFRRVYSVCEESIDCFHHAIEEIGALETGPERRAALEQYLR